MSRNCAKAVSTQPQLTSGADLAANVKWKTLKTIQVEGKKDHKRMSRALAKWPIDGRVVFNNVQMRYKPTANFALDGVNLDIKHGETVGIVGRTGSGKSSLLMALYRMFELAVRLLRNFPSLRALCLLCPARLPPCPA